MTKNPCIETTTTQKIVKGELKSPQWGGKIQVAPDELDGVFLTINSKVFNKSDLVWLADRLTEIAKAL